MPQEQKTRQEPQEHDESVIGAETTADAQERMDDLDAVLDDIESVLESNAEEYVNGFVQKGGE